MMRLPLLALLFSLATLAHAERRAETVAWAGAEAALSWYTPSSPGAHPALIHLVDQELGAHALESALPARDWVYSAWTLPGPSVVNASQIRELLAVRLGSLGLDASRLVLMGDANHALAVVAAADQLQRNADELRVRAVVVEVHGKEIWPELAVRAARWPSLLIRYRADDVNARLSAFALARHARVAGAAVQMWPASDAAAEADGMLLAWLAALDLRRVQRFDDTLIAPYRGADHERILKSIARPVADDAVIDPISGSPILAQLATNETLLADREGRVVRRTPSGVTVLEFDATAALSVVFGADSSAVEFASAAVTALVHPETGEAVLALPVRLRLPEGARSVLLLRRADASYSFTDLDDPRAVKAIAPSPSGRDHGRSWWLLMADADHDGHQLLRMDLHRAAPRRGIWWDPSRPGSAIDLQSVEGSYSLVFSSYDDAGKSRWYLASGHIEQQKFHANGDGLLLMRKRDPLAQPTPDKRFSGRVGIDFSIDATHPACRARDAKAAQLALFSVRRDGRDEVWCIEPFPLPAGVPERDVSGAWYGGRNDSGWGLSVVHAGTDTQSMISAVLYFHDAEGWPRWALGSARSGADGASLMMYAHERDCGSCQKPVSHAVELGEMRLRLGGWCGAPELRAAIELNGATAMPFHREEMALHPVALPRCY
jgi:hypothetical protein